MHRACLLLSALSCGACMTFHNPGFVAERIGFVAASDDLTGAREIGAVEAAECYGSPFESADSGPEALAWERFLSTMRTQKVRYATDVSSDHVNQMVFVPWLGGFSQCVVITGRAWR
jgi:hypothetical protein